MKFNELYESILSEDTSSKGMKLLKQLHSILKKDSAVDKVTAITTDKEFNDSGFNFFVNGVESQVSADINGNDNLVYYIGDDETPGEIHTIKDSDPQYQQFREIAGI